MTRILILCTGNTCRSQMAEGFLKSIDKTLEIYSAGTEPGKTVHPKAVEVMMEKNIDISKGYPKHVNQFINIDFDYVITVCDGAKEVCPLFSGNVKNRLHIGFDDPAEATGTDEEITAVFKRVRNEIFRDFTKFYKENIHLRK